MAGQAGVGGFGFTRVLARSFGLLRERWLSFAILTFGLGFAPRLVVNLTVPGSYHTGSHDLGAFAITCATALGLQFALHFSNSTVVAASLGPKTETSPVLAILSVLGALPSLALVWLVSEYDRLWSLWSAWANPFKHLRESNAFELVMVLMFISLLQLVLALASAMAIGVITPVILAERRAFAGAVARTWRLMSGSRWQILGLYVLVEAAAVAVSVPAWGLQVRGRAGAHHDLYVFLRWTDGAVSDAVEAFWGVVAASAYLELRRVREGAPQDQVAEIFA